MKKFKALMVWAAVVTATSASAQSIQGYYGEVGYLPLSVDVGGVSVSPQLARAMVGVNVHDNLSVEGMAAVTVVSDTYQNVDISANAWGVFLKPKFQVTQDTQVFARVGHVSSELKASVSNYSASLSGSDVGYGLGVQTQITSKVYGQIDYMSYYNKNGFEAKGFTVSVGTRF